MTEQDQLTPNERAMLLVLITEGREIGNAELFEQYGFKVTAPVREHLSALGLVQVSRHGRAYLHEVTDQGWARAGAVLGADFEIPARPTRVQVAAWKALAGVTARYLAATGTRPSAFFAPQASEDEPEPGTDSTEDLDGQIRDAYWKISERPHQRVPLADLRLHLDGADPDAVSAALLRMFADGRINLTPGADQKSRRRIDDRASVRAGGEAKHFVSMAAS